MAITVSSAPASLIVTLAQMSEHDLLEVVEIEDLSGLSPWGWDAYHKELQAAHDVIMLVARTAPAGNAPRPEKELAGFIVSRLIAGELHVNNVAVRTEFRRQGIGVKLLRSALDWAAGRGAGIALLEVREGNQAAQALYSRCGFQVVGRRPGYYNQPVEDALLMTVSLPF
ncbi:MAG: ribosomal protein S18-alanine N-acetyltransferase [Acidobacteriota bacterium]